MLEYGKLERGQNILHLCNRNECSEISHLYLKTSKRRKRRKNIEKEELEEAEKDLQEFISTLKKDWKMKTANNKSLSSIQEFYETSYSYEIKELREKSSLLEKSFWNALSRRLSYYGSIV